MVPSPHSFDCLKNCTFCMFPFCHFLTLFQSLLGIPLLLTFQSCVLSFLYVLFPSLSMSSWRIYDSLNHFQTCSFCICVKKVTSYVTLLCEETDAKTAFLLKCLSHHLINGTCVCTWMCTFMRLSFLLLLNLFFDSSYIYWYILHPGCPHPHLSLPFLLTPLQVPFPHSWLFVQFLFCDPSV